MNDHTGLALLERIAQLEAENAELRQQSARDKQSIAILSNAVEGYQSGHVWVEIQKENADQAKYIATANAALRKELGELRKDRERLKEAAIKVGHSRNCASVPKSKYGPKYECDCWKKELGDAIKETK